MIRLLAPVGASTWITPILRDVERAFRDQRLPEYLQADLPPAEKSRGKQAIVTDINAPHGMTAFSNGTAWVRTDTGATL